MCYGKYPSQGRAYSCCLVLSRTVLSTDPSALAPLRLLLLTPAPFPCPAANSVTQLMSDSTRVSHVRWTHSLAHVCDTFSVGFRWRPGPSEARLARDGDPALTTAGGWQCRRPVGDGETADSRAPIASRRRQHGQSLDRCSVKTGWTQYSRCYFLKGVMVEFVWKHFKLWYCKNVVCSHHMVYLSAISFQTLQEDTTDAPDKPRRNAVIGQTNPAPDPWTMVRNVSCFSLNSYSKQVT